MTKLIESPGPTASLDLVILPRQLVGAELQAPALRLELGSKPETRRVMTGLSPAFRI